MRDRKDVFDALRKFIDDPDVDTAEKRAVMNVLSAIRGPDYDMREFPDRSLHDEKQASTAIIREKVFGTAIENLGYDVRADSDWAAHYRSLMRPEDHYINHVGRAFSALGLSWGKKNN